jgi:hypothetical protein
LALGFACAAWALWWLAAGQPTYASTPGPGFRVPPVVHAPLDAAPLAAAASTPGLEPAKPPPEYRIDKSRVYLSPLTSFSLRADLKRDQGPDNDEELRGVGVSIGADFIFQRYAALWLTASAGTITGVEGHVGNERIQVRHATGNFYVVEAGGAGVLSEGPFTGLAGAALTFADAEFTGIVEPEGAELDSSLTLTGAVLTLRGDYTLRNGFFAGLGVDYGLGRVGGDESKGTHSASGTILLIYIPLGWTY